MAFTKQKKTTKVKKYLVSNMARARIEKHWFEVKSSYDNVNQTIVDTQNNTLSAISDLNLTSQEFSTAATNKLAKNRPKEGSKLMIRKWESLENIPDNIWGENPDLEFKNKDEFIFKDNHLIKVLNKSAARSIQNCKNN